ncbi:hypothetical protein CJU73_14900 [Pseudomonas fragi]|jgi:flagellar hook-length control protein FliK|uniref:flagellar hook-length control protein FliK n=1 Tax=Pseudomonas fragi TaxID=296 RepID=UPI000BA1C4ED|nr:flagellar hook-length control protein FliK [Pseudomonas fragi]PAA27249.1 hypothetical protein CJU73_14900 [Pseudomonas fragi]
MNVSLTLPSGFAAALELRELPVEAAPMADDQGVLAYLAPLAEFEAPSPPPVDMPPLVASELAHEEQPGQPADVQQDPAVDPQQWLYMMLSQQAVQVQARDLAVSASPGLNAEPNTAPVPPGMAAPNGQQPAGDHDADAQDTDVLAPLAGPARTDRGPAAEGLAIQLQRREPPAAHSVLALAIPRDSAPLAALVQALPGPELATAPAALAQGAPAHGPVLERGLKLDTPQARWGEQMLHALRETVEVQVQQRFQQATIRLDPPELGSLEIYVSHESGRLSVHISAAQADVARLLASTSERLRQELVEHNSLQVQVQVSSDSQGHSPRDQGRSPREHAIAEAAPQAQASAESSTQRDNGVLVTV